MSCVLSLRGVPFAALELRGTTFSNIAGVDRDRRRVPCCVSVSRIQCGDKSRREGYVGLFKTNVYDAQLLRRLTLLLVKAVEALGGECRPEKSNTLHGETAEYA